MKAKESDYTLRKAIIEVSFTLEGIFKLPKISCRSYAVSYPRNLGQAPIEQYREKVLYLL